MHEPVVPSEPLRVAVIGAGTRSRSIYRPLFEALEPWLRLVAVCDPVKEHADELGEALDVPRYDDVRTLVADRPMEAALVITPVESHHSISCYLSAHGIHNLVETSWCSTLAQGREMADAAQQNGVVVRVAENFFRFPIDRIVDKIRQSGFIGEIRRIVSYDDHTGYHNNSRWIAFAGCHPEWVQSVEHTMPTAFFNSTPERHHDHETYRARFYIFPGNLLVADHAANAKGFLGRYPRPGYTEWHGERGTIAYSAPKPWQGHAEVRACSDDALATGPGVSDQAFPIVTEEADGAWTRTFVELPTGVVEHENPYRPTTPAPHVWYWYGSAIMDHVADFVLAARDLRESEFDEDDALMSMTMEVAARESALDEGRRIALPLEGEPESDRLVLKRIEQDLGVDPMDVEAMLNVSFPKP